MRSLNNSAQFECKRLLNIAEAAAYCGIGESKARIWFADIGAKRKFGTRSLYDRQVIDKALNNMQEV